MTYILPLKTKKRKKKVEENSRNFQGLAQKSILRNFQGKMEFKDFSMTTFDFQGLFKTVQLNPE